MKTPAEDSVRVETWAIAFVKPRHHNDRPLKKPLGNYWYIDQGIGAICFESWARGNNGKVYINVQSVSFSELRCMLGRYQLRDFLAHHIKFTRRVLRRAVLPRTVVH